MSDEIVERLRRAGCVFAEDEARLLREAAQGEALQLLVDKRVGGEPLEHLLGWVDVAGIRAAVGPGAFVPRQRSRVLVSTALEVLRDRRAPVVVEICCGVAAIGAAIAAARPDAEVWASDLDPVPLHWARRNLPPARVVQGDLFTGLAPALAGHIDLVVANAPYVPTGELDMMPVEAREHEPVLALDGGPDGVDLHRRIAAEVRTWLSASGAVVIETSRRQARLTAHAFAEQGIATQICRDDDTDGTAVLASLGG